MDAKQREYIKRYEASRDAVRVMFPKMVKDNKCLRDRFRVAAVAEGTTMTQLVVEWVLTWLGESPPNPDKETKDEDK